LLEAKKGKIEMDYKTYFSRQARKPAGIFGRFYMARLFEKRNAELNSFIFKMLSTGKNDHVLEIGFGTGSLMKKIADSLENGVVEGIDFSELMVAMAQRKNRKHIKNGKAKIHSGNFNDALFDGNSFDEIVSVNTIYFWENPSETLSQIYRLLRPGGKLFVGFHEKSEMEKEPLCKNIFQYYSTQDMVELLSVRGSLNNIKIVSQKGRQKTCFCAIGSK